MTSRAVAIAADVVFVASAVSAVTVAFAWSPTRPACLALAAVAVVALAFVWRTRATPRLTGHDAAADAARVPLTRVAMRVGVVAVIAAMLSALRSEPTPPTELRMSESIPVWPDDGGADVQPDAPNQCPAGMVHVAAGEFLMGSTDADQNAQPDERPQHRVRMSAFCIDRTEVTVAQYRACQGCAPPQTGGSCNWGQRDREDHPINCVDWNQADTFCRAQGKTLPTEAQWEYAARGTDGRIWPWGNEPPTATLANLCGPECVRANPGFIALPGFGDDGFGQTSPVGHFPAGAAPSGALDMVGNVWEWTLDYKRDYAATLRGLGADPRGPVDGTLRALRGGSWYGLDLGFARAAYRDEDGVTNRLVNIGFRCARGVTAGSVNRL